MKLLLDQNLSHRLVERLARAFPGSLHVRELDMSTADDATIWAYAQRHLEELLLERRSEIEGFVRDAEAAFLVLG